MTVDELNQNFLEIIEDLKSQPTGVKGHSLFKKFTGVAASEKVAQLHATAKNSSFKSVLKEKFERLGVKNEIAPALLAGIASRESSMGMALKSVTSIYYGWGTVPEQNTAKRSLPITVLAYCRWTELPAPFTKFGLN